MFKSLKEKYSLLSDFFEISVKNNKIPNSIILYGPDVIAQYFFAKQIARGANCLENNSEDCNCQNCRWIKANEHPEVITVSKIDSKPDGDDSKSVISVKQIDMIKDKLMITSDYHRCFIFCDAEYRELTELEKKEEANFLHLGMTLPKTDKESWVPLGINKKCFSDVVANALLKCVEEPPDKVTFIFLTENLENIISTIVSRSQAFYVSGNAKEIYDYSGLEKMLKNYPNLTKDKSFKVSEFVYQYFKDTEKPMPEIIMDIQSYLTDLLKQNSKNLQLKQIVLEDIKKLNSLLSFAKISAKEQVIADEIGYILTK